MNILKENSIGLVLFWLTFFISCSDDNKNISEEPQLYPRIEIQLTEEQQAMNEKEQRFAWKLFGRIYETEEMKNILISPFSFSSVLYMLQNGTDGETLDEILSITEMEEHSLSEMNSFYAHLVNGFIEADKSVTFNNANSIWYSHNLSLKSDFVQTNQNFYDTEMNSVDYGDPKTVDQINNWCSRKTNGKIREIIKETSTDDFFHITNALYFRATWENEFPKSATKESTFTLIDNSTVKTEFMKNKVSALYYESDSYAVSSLCFGNTAFEMFFILPHENVKMSNVINDIKNNWASLNWLYTTVEFTVPKFEAVYGIQMIDVLQSLGIVQLFNSSANLSKMTDSKVFASGVLQKNYFKINEEGAEGAAITITARDIAPPPSEPRTLCLNRSFLYGIRETSTGALLFIGSMKDPTQKDY